jgi:predicted secreted protein
MRYSVSDKSVLLIADGFRFLAIGTVVWWLVFFMILPIGITVDEQEKRQPGEASSAPSRSYIKAKFIIATIVSLLITAILFVFT